MDIIKRADGNGFTLTNHAGETLDITFMEFWGICRAGRHLDTKGEVEEYLAQCPDIDGHDLDRIRAFPALVDLITERVIDDILPQAMHAVCRSEVQGRGLWSAEMPSDRLR